MARLIHVSSKELPLGTRLNPWNLPASVAGWSELEQAIIHPTDLLRLVQPVILIEVAYEHVRAVEFREKPTRVTAAFACGRPESAMYFALMYRNRNVRFYEVEAIGQPWIADMALINPGPNLDLPIQQAIDGLSALARRYWASVSADLESALELPEVILPQSATVSRQLAPPFMR